VLEKTWSVPAVEDNSSTPEPSWYWMPYLWSDDGNYLYLQAVCLCSIDSPWLIYSDGYGIARLDLSTGQVDIWLKPSDNPWYSFAFSEDETLFAFSPNEVPRTIRIRDLVSGTEQDMSFKEKYSVLQYRWTPDHSKLVILTEESDPDDSKSGFSVFTYSVKSERLKKVLEKNRLNSSFPTPEAIEPRIFISELSNDILYLSDVYQENDFTLNIRTGELTQTSK
jgi:hypothetical protein